MRSCRTRRTVTRVFADRVKHAGKLRFPVPPVFVIPRARELIHRRLKADCLLCQPRGDPVTQRVGLEQPVRVIPEWAPVTRVR